MRPKWIYGLKGVDVLLDETQAAFLGSSGSLMLSRAPGECSLSFVLRAFRDRPTRPYLVNIPPGGVRKVELKYSRIRGNLRVWVNPTA